MRCNRLLGSCIDRHSACRDNFVQLSSLNREANPLLLFTSDDQRQKIYVHRWISARSFFSIKIKRSKAKIRPCDPFEEFTGSTLLIVKPAHHKLIAVKRFATPDKHPDEFAHII